MHYFILHSYTTFPSLILFLCIGTIREVIHEGMKSPRRSLHLLSSGISEQQDTADAETKSAVIKWLVCLRNSDFSKAILHSTMWGCIAYFLPYTPSWPPSTQYTCMKYWLIICLGSSLISPRGYGESRISIRIQHQKGRPQLWAQLPQAAWPQRHPNPLL